MKKYLVYLLVLVLLLSGCAGTSQPIAAKKADPTTAPTDTTASAETYGTQPTDEETVPTQATEPAATEPKEHQTLTAGEAPFDREAAMTLDLPEIGLQDVSVLAASSNRAKLEDGSYGQVLLLVYDRYKDSGDHYLVIMTQDKIIATDLAKWENMTCFDGEMAVCDFDGDGDSEILIQQLVGISGGAGSYYSRVLDVKDGQFVEMFLSDTTYEVPAGDRFDTGFSVELLENKQYAISNRFTGYREVFTKQVENEEYFDYAWYDKDGNLKKEDLWVDDFFQFDAIDWDHDGISEIKCTQCTWWSDHTDFMGYAHCVLKYNGESGQFEVVDAWVTQD